MKHNRQTRRRRLCPLSGYRLYRAHFIIGRLGWHAPQHRRFGRSASKRSRIALDDAEASLGEAWLTLSTQFALDENWPASASSASDGDLIADRSKCLGPHETTLTSFYASRRANTGDRARRFFVKRDGNTYRLYGCGFDEKGTRIAFGLYDVSGNNLTLNRLRRY